MSPHSEKDRIRASELLHQVFESLAGSRRFASHGAGLSTQLWPLLAESGPCFQRFSRLFDVRFTPESRHSANIAEKVR